MIIKEIVELIVNLIIFAVVILSTLMFIFAAILLSIDDRLEKKRRIKQ